MKSSEIKDVGLVKLREFHKRLNREYLAVYEENRNKEPNLQITEIARELWIVQTRIEHLEQIRNQENLLRYFSKHNKAPNLIQASPAILAPESIENLRTNANELLKLNEREFEMLIAELLHADGFEGIELIERSNAPGPDIIAFLNTSFGNTKYIIECKRWKDSVGIEVVRDLMYRVDLDGRASGGIIAATSQFTKPAIEEKKKLHEWRLNLRDSFFVRDWILRNQSHFSTKLIHPEISTEPKEKKRILDILSVPYSNEDLRLDISNALCQACGSLEVCGYIDLGGADYNHHYFHICADCAHFEYYYDFEMAGQESGMLCPFCRG